MPDLANIVEMKSSKRYAVDVRPLNCDTRLGEKERCSHCNQFHLRLGYCQALDPINAKVETESHDDETETEFETGESQPWIAEGISRATYFRRKRAAEGKA